MSRTAPNEALSAYLDGELTEAEAAALEAELTENAELRNELDAIQSVVTLLRDHGSVSAPDDFHAKVMAAAMAEAPVVTWWMWLRRPFGIPLEGLAVAAAAAAVLLLALPKGSPNVDSPESTPAAPQMITQEGGGTSDEGVNPQVDGDAALTQRGLKGSPTKVDDRQAETEPIANPIPNSPPSGVGDASPTEASTQDASIASIDANTVGNAGGTDRNPDAVLRNFGYSYTVYTDDPDALIGLMRTASRHSGTLTGLDNKPLGDVDIPPAGERSVVAHLPHNTIGAFEKELDKLGNVRRVENTKITSGDTMMLEVTVVMTGGAPKGSDGPQNAARKSRMQDDAMEQAADEILESL
mgnify:CR=1 FL=1